MACVVCLRGVDGGAWSVWSASTITNGVCVCVGVRCVYQCVCNLVLVRELRVD